MLSNVDKSQNNNAKWKKPNQKRVYFVTHLYVFLKSDFNGCLGKVSGRV